MSSNMLHTKYGVIAVIFATLLVSIAPNAAYAQTLPRLTVEVDKPLYGTGESIRINGMVPTVIEGTPVVIQIFNPNKVMYTVGQVMPEEDRAYSTSVKIGGKLGISGVYTLKVTYLAQSVQTKFEFTGLEAGQFNVHGVAVDATLSNGNIRAIKADPDFTSIILNVSTDENSDGMLEITLPREVLDSRMNGDDDDFIVLVNGEEEGYEETTSSTSRTLTVPIFAGAEEIEIIGTQVIPEFGILAALVLAAAVGAIVVLSRKSQILSPKVLPR